MSAYLQPGTSDRDEYFDLPNAGDGNDRDGELYQIPCYLCGKPTTWDATYQDLCYRCVRADNE